jgi:hypothetical protein
LKRTEDAVIANDALLNGFLRVNGVGPAGVDKDTKRRDENFVANNSFVSAVVGDSTDGKCAFEAATGEFFDSRIENGGPALRYAEYHNFLSDNVTGGLFRCLRDSPDDLPLVVTRWVSALGQRAGLVKNNHILVLQLPWPFFLFGIPGRLYYSISVGFIQAV